MVLETLPAGGGRVELTPDQADVWLAALNDVRLALGTALDVSEDMPDDAARTTPAPRHLGVYHWLTFVQDGLVQSRMPHAGATRRSAACAPRTARPVVWRVLVIRRDLVDGIVAHARWEHPHEACGLIAGGRSAGGVLVIRADLVDEIVAHARLTTRTRRAASSRGPEGADRPSGSSRC